MHIRMMYHLNGIDYVDDPYNISGERSRDIFKIISLILVNASSEKEAIRAIRNELKGNGNDLDLTDKGIKKMIHKFRDKHDPILNLIGKGLKMQFLDSKIAERIIINMMKENIPVLAIHDSFVVQKEYESTLSDEMINSYKKETGFRPVVH